MGFPRKHETARIYRDKDKRTYFVLLDQGQGFQGNMDAIANVYPGNDPSFVGTGIHMNYVWTNWLKRCQFNEIPENYQNAIRQYLAPHFDDEPDDYAPELIRGFWRVGEQPVLATV